MNEKDTCEIYCYDGEKVTRIQGELQSPALPNYLKLLQKKTGRKSPLLC